MAHDHNSHPNPFINLIYFITVIIFGTVKPFFDNYTKVLVLGNITFRGQTEELHISAQMMLNVIVSALVAWFVTMILKSIQLWYKRQKWGFSVTNVTREKKSSAIGVVLGLVGTYAFLSTPPKIDTMAYLMILGVAVGLCGLGDKWKSNGEQQPPQNPVV